MRERSVYKKALTLAVPMMIQNGITNAVSLVDNLMVGSLGTESLTAVSIVGQLIFVFFSGRFRWTFRSGNLWSTVFRTGQQKRLSECVSFEVVDHSGYCSGGDDSFCRRWRTVDRFVSPWFIPWDGCGRYVGAGKGLSSYYVVWVDPLCIYPDLCRKSAGDGREYEADGSGDCIGICGYHI